MINRLGLILFILGCFGCLQETIKPSVWGGWMFVAEAILIVGACLHFLPFKEE